MNSDIALKIYSLVKNGTIKSNAMFWKDFYVQNKVDEYNIDTKTAKQELEDKKLGIICVFDNNFPIILDKIKNSEKPFLFVYKGNIELLKEIQNNVAVVGVLTPTDNIKNREQKIVKELINKNLTVVSGLAKGCDSIAHKTCLDNKAKTVAILPTTFDNIYPKENAKMIDEIVEAGGLIISEYISEPTNKYERIRRFIDRDRLQVMFSKSVILIASYTPGNGDSGSRHAMTKAKEYNKTRYVMFNENSDSNQKIFELNEQEIKNGAIILTSKTML